MLNITASRRARRNAQELNMAPLIDMVFILLIFFLVTTSFVRETGVDVKKPLASTATAEDKTSVLIGITQDNRVFMDREEISPASVRAYVERALAETPEAKIIIVADEKSTTGAIVRVMDACKLAGADNISIAAGKKKS